MDRSDWSPIRLSIPRRPWKISGDSSLDLASQSSSPRIFCLKNQKGQVSRGANMQIRLSVVDYNAEWALKERNQIPSSKPGYLTCEEVVSFYGTLGVYGIELMHYYWIDYTPAQLRQLVTDAGLSIACFVFLSDLALPLTERGRNVDEACRLLDRTAELGTSLAMI